MPPKRDQAGYAAWCIEEIQAGRCPCDGCSGQLTDPARSPAGWAHCRTCGCAQKITVVGGQAYPFAIPAPDRCPDAARQQAVQRREDETVRRRWQTGE